MASQFFVQYLDSDNKLIQKNVSSNSAGELEREISDKGGELLSVVEKKNRSINIQLGDPVKLQEKTNFIQQLKTMLSSGVSLVQSLEIAVKQIENDVFNGNNIKDISNKYNLDYIEIKNYTGDNSEEEFFKDIYGAKGELLK